MIYQFKKVTDKSEIRKILHEYMLNPKRRESFLFEIFSREHRQGGIIYEGARPLSSSTTSDETTYTLTNGSSGYTQPIAVLKLSQIEYVTELPS